MRDIIIAVLQHDAVYSHLLPWLLGPPDARFDHTHADLIVEHLPTARLVGPVTAAAVRMELLTFIVAALTKLLASPTAEPIENRPALQMEPKQEQGRVADPRATLGSTQRRTIQAQLVPTPAASQTAPKGAWGKATPAKQLFTNQQHQQRASNGRLSDVLAGQRTPGTPAASTSQQQQGSAASTPGSSTATSYATASSARYPLQDPPSGIPQSGTPQASRCSSSSAGHHFNRPVSSQVSTKQLATCIPTPARG
jgi:hypothetical protein